MSPVVHLREETEIRVLEGQLGRFSGRAEAAGCRLGELRAWVSPCQV